MTWESCSSQPLLCSAVLRPDRLTPRLNSMESTVHSSFRGAPGPGRGPFNQASRSYTPSRGQTPQLQRRLRRPTEPAMRRRPGRGRPPSQPPPAKRAPESPSQVFASGNSLSLANRNLRWASSRLLLAHLRLLMMINGQQYNNREDNNQQ